MPSDTTNTDCKMPECTSSPDIEVHAVRDPEGKLLDMCEVCLDDGWRQVVEVIDSDA